MFKDSRQEQQRINERKLLEAKLEDQYRFAISKNKITHTDFLNCMEKQIAEKFLCEQKIQNDLFFGGNGEDSDRHILLFYPDKFSQEMVEKNIDTIVSVIQIQLPKDISYEHRIYLSGILKLGIKREKIGDILVRENGADIFVLKEVSAFLEQNLQELTRFKGAKCKCIKAREVQPLKKQFEEIRVIVSSMRLDNFVSELAKCSRTRAAEIIDEQRVLVNYEIETKFSKKIETNDVITIRGKGKFIVQEIERKTKAEKYVVMVKKLIG